MHIVLDKKKIGDDKKLLPKPILLASKSQLNILARSQIETAQHMEDEQRSRNDNQMTTIINEPRLMNTFLQTK
jgi:hypothetical protein